MSRFEPLVSIIMPAYNAEATIQSSIESVVAQTYPNWELIAIDDKSHDATHRIVKAIAAQDPRIRLYSNGQNLGTAETRNYGISQSQGQYIAFLDSDDLWHADKLTRQLEFMKETGATISYTSTAYIYEGTRSNYILRAKQQLTYRELLKRNLMSCSSVMVCRDMVNQTPFVKGDNHEDYALWLKILRKVKYAHGLDEPLLIYRVSHSSKSGRLFRSGIMTYRTFRSVGFMSFFALLLTLRYALHSVRKRVLIRRL